MKWLAVIAVLCGLSAAAVIALVPTHTTFSFSNTTQQVSCGLPARSSFSRPHTGYASMSLLILNNSGGQRAQLRKYDAAVAGTIHACQSRSRIRVGCAAALGLLSLVLGGVLLRRQRRARVRASGPIATG